MNDIMVQGNTIDGPRTKRGQIDVTGSLSKAKKDLMKKQKVTK